MGEADLTKAASARIDQKERSRTFRDFAAAAILSEFVRSRPRRVSQARPRAEAEQQHRSALPMHRRSDAVTGHVQEGEREGWGKREGGCPLWITTLYVQLPTLFYCIYPGRVDNRTGSSRPVLWVSERVGSYA